MNKFYDLVNLLRVHQWFKNIFILIPLIFSGRLLDTNLCLKNLNTFLAFCLLSGAAYIYNDLHDLTSDKVHPEKSQRPLASGLMSPLLASIGCALLLAAGLILGWKVNIHVFFMGLVYITLNYTYNAFTKKRVLLDVMSIALGFHVRIWAGSLAVGVTPSIWLQMCTFVLALFLGFAKRRHELFILDNKAMEHREVLSHYTLHFLDQMIMICCTLAVVFYGLYTISINEISHVGHQNILYSTVFVIYGIFRYLYLIHVQKMGGDPGYLLFNDKHLLTCVLLWAGCIFLAIYGHSIF